MTTQHLSTIRFVFTKRRTIACVVVLGVLTAVFAFRREPPEPTQEDRLKDLQISVRPFIASLAKVLRLSEEIQRDKLDSTVTMYFPDHVRCAYEQMYAANREYETVIPPLLKVARKVSAGDLSAKTVAEYEAQRATYFEKLDADKPIRRAYETVYVPYANSKFPFLAIDILHFVTEQQTGLSKEHAAVGEWTMRHLPKVRSFANPPDTSRTARQFDDAHKARLEALLSLRKAALPVAGGDLQQLRQLQKALQQYQRCVEASDKAARSILTGFPVGAKRMDFYDYLHQARSNKQLVNSLAADFPIPDRQGQLNGWIRAIDDKVDPKNLGVSWLAYRKMRQGMDYYTVCDYIGTHGQSQSEAGKLTTYAWRDGLSTIVATFRSGKLVSKSQLGL